MARNILLTSLSAMDTVLQERYFSVQGGSGPAYLEALLDTEAGIKTVLSQYDIDEIIVIGAGGSYDEGDEIGIVPLRQESSPDPSAKTDLSTYGLLRNRIAQYADGQMQSRMDDDEGLPEEVREKLISFIRDFTGRNSELKSRELSRLFDELAQNDGICGRFWTELFEACPELCDDPASCRQWVKRYLYAELEPSLKTGLLPSNGEAGLCFIPEAELEGGEQWVDSLMEMERSIADRGEEEDVDLYITLNSDDAADTFILLNVLDILISMPESRVRLKKLFTVRSQQKRIAGIVRDDTEGFGVTELFHAIRAFLNYGRADMIMDIWKKSGESNESIASMVYAMRDVDVGLSMCNIPEVERGILSLRELFKSENFWRESGYYGMLFTLIAESIREDYGVLLEGEGEINFIEMVKWAYRHQFYQQTLTLIESRTPENIVRSGIFYYCDNEENVDQVTRLFAEQRLRLRPQEFFKMDQIDHYFIKAYDRYRNKWRKGKGQNPQRVYAELRTEAVGNQDPSHINGFTECDSLETLQDALFAYYNVGYIRNQISHANDEAMERKNQSASDGEEISALAWMKDSIELFIRNYEKAMAEVKDKNPNVIIVTADEVRKLAESMRENERHGR